jgi:hypothetical protein
MKATDVQRFWAKVLRTDTCWLWIGAKQRGYGALALDGKVVRAHRFSYELFNGSIPKGLEIDHLCLTRACVRPDHLEAVTRHEHCRRGMSPPAIYSRRTHCKRGHLLGGDNIYVWGKGRACRTCALANNIERARRYAAAEKP